VEQEKRRVEIIKEIVETERSYINSLGALSKHFIEPLRAAGEEVISPQDIRSIFSEIEVIRAYNTQLFGDLTNESKKLGDIFLAMVSIPKKKTQTK
jgi:hypothetical protein